MTRTIYGSPISPFVRKAVIALELKGLDYELVQVTPVSRPDNYQDISPLGKIPAMFEGDMQMADSTVICEYLDEAYDGFELYPGDPAGKARVRWFEEYADSFLVQVCGLKLFFERVVKPRLMQLPCDEAVVEQNLAEEMPKALAYLEKQTEGVTWLVGDKMTMADIAVATMFVNAFYAGFQADSETYPNFTAWLGRVFSTDVFAARMAADKAMMSGGNK